MFDNEVPAEKNSFRIVMPSSQFRVIFMAGGEGGARKYLDNNYKHLDDSDRLVALGQFEDLFKAQYSPPQGNFADNALIMKEVQHKDKVIKDLERRLAEAEAKAVPSALTLVQPVKSTRRR